MSLDGRYVAFASDASDLVPGDTNLTHDIFVHDQLTATTTRVSVSSLGVEGNNFSYGASISSDGRYVAFYSDATNLVAGDMNSTADVFVHDRDADNDGVFDETGPGDRSTVRVSVDSNGIEGDGSSFHPSISADGRFVAFDSDATNLVVGDGNGERDVFVHDRQTGQTTRVSVDSSGNEATTWWSDRPSISADGKYVAFQSRDPDLVAGDTNGELDIFVHDRQTGQTTRVSVDTSGNEAMGHSVDSSISADGRYVAFASLASNLVPGDTNGFLDTFIKDRQTGQTTRISVDSSGNGGNDASYGSASFSVDGRYVSFSSDASNLVPGDMNGVRDFFVHDRQTGQTTRVSINSEGVEGDGANGTISSLSGDGRYLSFASLASNLVLGDTNGTFDVFVHDRDADANGIYDEAGGIATSRVSLSSIESNWGNEYSLISANARYVAFVSLASNLVPGDTNGVLDIFVHDRQTGQTSRVSVDSGGNEGNGGSSGIASFSADGRYVAFASLASNLVPGDTNGSFDIFVHDRQTGITTRVSVDSGGSEGNGISYQPSISADGRYVAFYSDATNLVPGDTNGVMDVFVHDRQTGQTSRVSVDNGGSEGNQYSYRPSISADGRYVAFASLASNLVPGDTSGVVDIFVHDRQTGQTSRVSVDSGGSEGNQYSGIPSISADGRYVAFASLASNLVSGDTNGVVDIFVHDRQTGQTTRVSVDSGGSEGNGISEVPSISADGRYVAFQSFASNLVPGDTNGVTDIFVHSLTDPCASLGGDTDGDGYCDAVDCSPLVFNLFQVDTDRDGVCDPTDICPNDYNPGQNPSDPCTTKNSGTAAIVDPAPVYKEGDPILVQMCFTFTDTSLLHFVPDCYNAVAMLVDITDPANPKPVPGRCLIGPPYTVNPYPDGDLVPVTGSPECIVCDLAKWFPPEVTGVPSGTIGTFQLTGVYQNYTTDYEIDPKIWVQTGDIFKACTNQDPTVGCTTNVLVGKLATQPSTIRLEDTTDTLVRIEIKPGSPPPKPINLGASIVPVAVLGSATFDVSTVDPLSILLENRGAKVKGNGTAMTSTKDVNGDGYADLVVQIDVEGLSLTSSVDYASVTGTYTVGGQTYTFKGYDYVKVVP